MKRNFTVIFKINDSNLFESIFDSDCKIGNGLYKMNLGGNKKSTFESISKKAVEIVNRHKGLKIELIDVMEL